MKNFIFLILSLCLFYSCNENKHAVVLLEKAQSIVENNPAEALALLDSIRNPKDLIIMLCYFIYPMKAIAAILNLVYNSTNIEYKKLDIRNKLVWSGFSESEANQMIFPDGDIP